MVPDDDLDLCPLPGRAGPAGGGHPLPVRDSRSARRLLRRHRGSLHRPIVVAAVVAGVAGTAITAIRRRKIAELDALQVLGVDPIKNLVVPRFLALMIITGLLDIFAVVFGMSAGIAAEPLYHQPLGGFF